MVTHLIKSINWVDVAVVVLIVRMIFEGVKNGFFSELFKFFGVIVSVFVSLHYYSFLAAWAAVKTNFSWDYWGLLIFAVLWFATALFFKFLGNGIAILFNLETNHQGFDKYAAGVLSVARGILVSSLIVFLILLTQNGPLTRMTLRSYSYKIAGRAGVSTYSFLYNNLVSKLFPSQHYNSAAARVLLPENNWPKHRI